MQVWRKKRSESKTALVRQKIFHMVVCLKIPFHPNQPTFGRDEIFFSFFYFFFPFFFLIFVRSSFLLNHKTWKSNFCVKLLSCKCNFFSRNFLGQLHRQPPENGALQNPFFERLKLECYFSLLSVDI